MRPLAGIVLLIIFSLSGVEAADIIVDAPTANTVATTNVGDTVTVTDSGSIEPPSPANGISAAQGDHVITVQGGGSITVTGDYAAAILAQSGGSTITNSGTLTGLQSGVAVRGIVAEDGNQQVTNHGMIQTESRHGFGIHAKGGTSQVENSASGLIVTHGQSASGIRGEGGGTYTNSGSIQTHGTDADAINAGGGDSELHNSGQITTYGDGGYGMICGGDNDHYFNSGSITTHGADAVGIRAAGGTVENHGTIATLGEGGAYGVKLQSNVSLDNYGTIQALNASAVYCAPDSPGIVVNLRPGSDLIGGITCTASSPSTLNIDPGAMLTIRVDDAGNADLVDMAGPVNINGGTLRIRETPGIYQKQTVYTVVNASGGVTGTFDKVVTGSNFRATPIYETNAVLVALAYEVMPVPTLSEWGLYILLVCLAAVAVRFLYRRGQRPRHSLPT